MKVKDLRYHIYDKVYIYTLKNGSLEEFEDLYKGDFEGIPDKLLNSEVGTIGARGRNILDISIILNLSVKMDFQ